MLKGKAPPPQNNNNKKKQQVEEGSLKQSENLATDGKRNDKCTLSKCIMHQLNVHLFSTHKQ